MTALGGGFDSKIAIQDLLDKNLPSITWTPQKPPITTLNISQPDSMKSFVDEHMSLQGYGTSSAYLCGLIRRDPHRVFYVEQAERVEVWRVLHDTRKMSAGLLETDQQG